MKKLSINAMRHLELGRCHIETHLDLVQVTSLFRGLHEHFESRLDVTWRREATLVSNEGSVATELGLDDSLKSVEDLSIASESEFCQILRV